MEPQRFSVRSYVSHPAHGPLPAILLLLTVATGLVDATSILGLGRVFVANMTGNIVFIGFALAGAPGFSLWGSVTALVAFLVGASAGGAMVQRATHRARLLRNALVVQAALVLLAVVVAVLGSEALPQLGVLAAIALALGVQNAVVRSLAVPDMTTTVLTMTLTGIAADVRSGDLATAVRRLASVVAMLVGAVIGALLVLHFGTPVGLGAVLVLTLVALVAASSSARATSAWTAPKR